MMFVMTSKDLDLFFNNETDDAILNAQYVIVSNRIRRARIEYENIMTALVLFPDPAVMTAFSNDEFKNAYIEQLNQNISLIAVLVTEAIIHKYNIIFLCTRNETKLSKFIYILADFIYDEFEYPVYRYKDLASGKIKLIDIDEARAYKKAKAYIKDAKAKSVISNVKNESKLKNSEKKMLKKLLKDRGLYKKGMTISEMKNIVDIFI